MAVFETPQLEEAPPLLQVRPRASTVRLPRPSFRPEDLVRATVLLELLEQARAVETPKSCSMSRRSAGRERPPPLRRGEDLDPLSDVAGHRVAGHRGREDGRLDVGAGDGSAGSGSPGGVLRSEACERARPRRPARRRCRRQGSGVRGARRACRYRPTGPPRPRRVFRGRRTRRTPEASASRRSEACARSPSEPIPAGPPAAPPPFEVHRRG